MTFEAFETSQEAGQPVELYKFTAGTLTFRFTSAQDEQIVGVTAPVNIQGTYEPIPIHRGRVQASADGARKDGIQIEMPSSNEFAQRYINIVPGVRSRLEIFKFHRGDTPTPEFITVFKGDIQTVSFTKQGRLATMQVLSLARAKGRAIPRFTYQGPCNHMLYDARCKISETDPSFEKFLTVASIDSTNTVLTVTGAGGFPSLDFFVSGFLEFDDDFRTVVKQDGIGEEDLTILVPFLNSPVGQTIRCLAGCQLRLTLDCDLKFANVINFGGFPYVPKKNPFVTGVDK